MLSHQSDVGHHLQMTVAALAESSACSSWTNGSSQMQGRAVSHVLWWQLPPSDRGGSTRHLDTPT